MLRSNNPVKEAAIIKAILSNNYYKWKREKSLSANGSTINSSKNIQPTMAVVWCLRINSMCLLSLLPTCAFIISETMLMQDKVKSKEKTQRTCMGSTASVSNYGIKLRPVKTISGPHSLFTILCLASSFFHRVSSPTSFSPSALTNSLPIL